MNSTTVLGRTVFNQTVNFLINSSILYYLSCFLLLLGAYLMMHSPWLSGGVLTKYCEIYGIFLSYVIVLTGVGLIIFRRLAMAQDGLVVACLVLLLVLDPAFFNNVFYTYSLRAGLFVGSLGFVLGVTLYVALTKLAPVPWTKTSTITTASVAAFIYYYPLGLNIPQAEATKSSCLYLFWWMPLLVAVFFERLTSDPPVSAHTLSESQTVISHGLVQKFRLASILIVFCMLLAHLMAASYTYSLDLHPEYLTPVFLAVGLLCSKLNPSLGPNARQFLWVCTILAVGCSCGTAERFMIHIRWSMALSPFRYGFGATALYLVYFWKTCRGRSWATAAILCLACAVSGASLSDSLFNICHFHFVPFAYFTLVFVVSFLIERSWIFAAMAGACALISALSLTPVHDYNKVAIFLQLGAAWIGLVQWYFYQSKHQNVYSLIGAFVLLVPSVMWCVAPDHLAWGAGYFLTVTSLYFAARFLGNKSLSTLAVFGVVGGALYLARSQLVSFAAEFRRAVNFGLLATILAFLILPLAFFLSVLKVRQRKHRDVKNELV